MGFPINTPSTRFIDERGNVTMEWYRFLSRLQLLVGSSDEGSFAAAPVITYGPSTVFDNEKMLTGGTGISLSVVGAALDIDLDDTTVAPGTYGGATKTVTLAIDQQGRITAVSESTLPALASGVYTPTLTNVANLDASTAQTCQYLRVGNSVTVSGRVEIDPTAAATATRLGISLPVASNFTGDGHCCGTAAASAIAGQCAAILADATNDRAEMQWISGDTSNQAMFFTFTYRIL